MMNFILDVSPVTMDFFWGVTLPIILFLIGLIITILAGIRPLLSDIKEQTKDVPKMFEKLVVLDTRTEALPSMVEKITTLEVLTTQRGSSSPLDPKVRLKKSDLVVDVRAKEIGGKSSTIEIYFPIDVPRDAFEAALRGEAAIIGSNFTPRLVRLGFYSREPSTVAHFTRKFLERLDSELYKLTHWSELFGEAIVEEFKEETKR